jgi:hypothetical protein
MKPIERSEIVDYVTYEETRNQFRGEVMKAKAVRRVHVGEYLTFLFENPLTVRYQIQEMMRAERIVREADIRHEIQTYNELLGKDGELGCTLLIEIDNPAVRDEKLREWRDLPEHVYAVLEDGARIQGTFDDRQRDQARLSSVQYLKFDTRGKVPVQIGVDLVSLKAETRLLEEVQEALRADLQKAA